MQPDTMQPETALEIDDASSVLGDPPKPDVRADLPSEPSMVRRLLAIAGVLVLYAIYRELRVGAGRDVFQRGLPVRPFRHALTVLKVERWLWLDFERGWQRLALNHGLLIRLSNAYYAWAHQAMTLGLAIVLLLRAPWAKARHWVGAVLLQLPLDLAIFAMYPLMPPRLLDAGAPWGGRVLELHRRMHPSSFVDTLVKVSGPWSPQKYGLDSFTNQFAAMPSLHCGFSLWVGIVWWQWARGTSWRFVGPLHAIVMFWCVVVTGNHFVLDALMGWGVAIAGLVAMGHFKRAAPQADDLEQGVSNLMPSMTSTWQ